MKVQGTQRIPAGPERVYDLLLDPVVLAACIPGCEELIRVEEGIYKMKMKVKLAAVSGDFSGTVKIADAVRPTAFHMAIEGAGRIGHMKGEGVLQLSAEEAETQVHYEGDVQVGGAMAAVGQRLIDVTSKMIIRNFFGNLTAKTQQA